MRLRHALAAIVFVSLPAAAAALPSAPGYSVSIHASVIDPVRLSADPSGALFVGRDSSGSGGLTGEPCRVQRIGAGGSPVTPYGTGPIVDPDAVFHDAAGIMGTVNAVIVGGLVGDLTGGHLTSIQPDQSVVPLHGPVPSWHNPTDFAADATGRLLFTNFPNPGTSTPGVFHTSGGPPVRLFGSVANPYSIAVSPANELFVSFADGTLRRYSPAGALLDSTFAVGMRIGTPVAIGSLSGAARALYAISATNQLVRLTFAGAPTVLGTAFESVSDLEFGPDGVLYMSEFENDRVLRLVRAVPGVSPAAAAILMLGLSACGAAALLRRFRRLEA